MTKIDLSVVILAKNEETMIGDAIDSASFAEKVIVVNNNSTDSTVEIAKKKGAQVVEIDSKDFSELRSFPLKKINTTYVMYLDADERISEELQAEIVSTITESSTKAGYRIPRKNYYYGQHPWPSIEHLERLFKTAQLKGWKGKLHETAQVDGRIGDLSGFILHYTHRELSLMIEKTNQWSDTEALLRFSTKHPRMSWWRFPRVMITAFFDSYIRQSGWKAGTAGVVESIYQAFSMFVTYAKLWELQQKEKE